MFPILAYSQTEVIKITENKDAQLKLIDRFIDTHQLERDIEEIREPLQENDVQLNKGIHARDLLVSCERQINTLEAQIEAINNSLSNPLFDAMKLAEEKKQVFEDRQSYVRGLTDLVTVWREQLTEGTVEALPDDFSDDADLLKQQVMAENARSRGLELLTDLIADLNKYEQTIGDTLTDWMPEFDKVAAKYVELLKEIGGDREAKEKDRQRLEREKLKLEKEAKEHQSVTERLPELLEARSELLDKLERAYRNYYEVRKAKFDQLTDLSDGKLKLTLEHAADRSLYGKILNDLLKGGQNSLSVADRRQIAANVPPRRLVELVLDRDTARLADEAGITELWAGRAIEKLWSVHDFTEVLALQHDCYPTDVPSIRFRKEGGQYDELDELSVGQKCTALLIIALCDGTMPIVIDQPEDALDIISVWEDIAKKLRRGKNSRQFILTTHNSSVAVAADSDQFIVLRAGANYGKVVAAGAIDRPDVREAVIKHLEGGDEPYKLRLLKYNIA
jgi:hypothetical protein